VYGQETNVVKLYNLVSVEEGSELKQRAYYLEGIGANDVDKSGKAISDNVEILTARFVPEKYHLLQLMRSVATGM